MEPTKTSSQVEARIRELYGPVELPASAGVIHVVSTFEQDDGMLRVIKIGPGAPKSETDFFVLNLARARADILIITGKILRDEPTLRYDLQGPSAQGLHAYRREVLGKADPPRVIVLTSGRGLDFDHPTFDSWARPVVFTREDVAASLGGGSVDVVGHANPSISSAIEWARGQGAETISIEAGPTTARVLYESPLQIDELLLSTFEGSVSEAVRGPSLIEREAVRRGLTRSCAPSNVDEPSGRWRFERWIRPSPTSRAQ